MEQQDQRVGEPDARLAVVMITRDRKQEVLASLGHLERLPERPRVVLVDNGSSDGTAAAVAEKFPGVTVLEAGGNLGAAARNLGARHAEAEYVAFCDDDTWWAPGSLRLAADLLDAHPRLALAMGRVLVGAHDREDPFCEILDGSPLPRHPDMPGPSLLGFIAGGSVARRSAFLSVGGFEAKFQVGGEEGLVAADMAAQGWWICYVPRLIVHHHPSPSRDPARRRRILARNAVWFAWLRRPWPVAVRRTFLAARQPWRPETWRTLAECLAGLPWALRNRRLLPTEVERGLRVLERRG